MNEMQSMGGGVQFAAPKANDAVAMVFQTREMVETLGMMQMARMNPREVAVVRKRLLDAASDEKLAVAAKYIYAKGGTEVTGLSIRAAETMARAVGNIDFGCRELEETADEKIVQAYCWDMERNTRNAEVFRVPKARSKGVWDGGRRVGTQIERITDQREIDEMTRSRGSRIKRGCILATIDVNFQEEFADACDATLAKKVEKIAEKKGGMVSAINGMLDALKDKYGVTKEQVAFRFQKKRPEDLANLDNRQFVMLLRILTGLKDGIATPADYFKGATTERARPTEIESKPADKNAKTDLKAAMRAKSAKSASTSADGAKVEPTEGATDKTPQNADLTPNGEHPIDPALEALI